LRFAGNAGVSPAEQDERLQRVYKNTKAFCRMSRWAFVKQRSKRYGFGLWGETPNAAYYLQLGYVKGSLESPMCLAFAGNAGVPPAAAKQMKESKRQSK
jgi:hypothetical protein